MSTYLRRLACAFAIGLTMGSAYAESSKMNRRPADNSFADARGLTSREAISGDRAFAQSETFVVLTERVPYVLSAMDGLGLSEDVDFAWMNKVQKNSKTVNFVCYSADCHEWAKNRLRVVTKAPVRPEEAIGLKWKDADIESKRKESDLSEDEKIKARHQLRYTKARISS